MEKEREREREREREGEREREERDVTDSSVFSFSVEINTFYCPLIDLVKFQFLNNNKKSVSVFPQTTSVCYGAFKVYLHLKRDRKREILIK